jgi:hypothetical protein
MHGCKTIYCFKKDVIPSFSGDGFSMDVFAEGGSSFSPFYEIAGREFAGSFGKERGCLLDFAKRNVDLEEDGGDEGDLREEEVCYYVEEIVVGGGDNCYARPSLDA